MRVEINEIDTRKTIENINEIKICFFLKINKVDKPLGRLRKKERQLKQNYKRKKRHYNLYYRNVKDLKRLPRTFIHPQIGQPRRSREIPGNI